MNAATMFHRCLLAALVTAAAPMTVERVWAHDEQKYPTLAGQWVRAHPRSQWDPSKPRGLAQQAPLTAEYQAIFEANLAALRATTVDPQLRCLPAGTPRMMIAYEPLEFILTTDAVYIRTDHLSETRRIYTDGRDWPAKVTPSYWGYSIGTWIDQDGDGRYDLLAVETRHFKGPRYLDADGLPLHKNNRTIVKERIFLDRANPDFLHAEITTIDDAFTRPWTVTRNYKRERNPVWPEYLCAEANNHVIIGKERYFRSADDHLMPLRKDQPPPDLRNFDRPR
jgi:hypothetical protein